MKKLLSIISCIIIIVASFSGCSDKKEIINYIYPINGQIENFDPQIASTTDEFVLIENTFEGLVRVNDDGTIKSGVAESWSTSSDGLTYTFNIRKGTKWRINDSVIELMGEDFNPDITANDFVFALRRAATAQTDSPLFSTIACIKNAVDVNAGRANIQALGVEAKDDYTLVITLSTPNDDFMNVLASPIAMPCNEQFFNATAGRYGLKAKYTLFNGQFYLRQVLESSYLLRNNESYVSESTSQDSQGEKSKVAKKRIDLTLKIIDEENASKTLELIEKGYYDAAFISGSDADKIKKSSGVSYTPYIDTTWGFLYNCNDLIFKSKSMREAFSLSISRKETYKEEYFTDAKSFAPPSCKVGSDTVANTVSHNFSQDTQKSMQLWSDGLNKIGNPKVEITVLTTKNMESTVKELIQGVQSSIGSISSYNNGKPMQFTLKVEALPKGEFNDRISSGDYDVAFCSFKAESPSAVSFYSNFASQNKPKFDTSKLNSNITSASQSFDNAKAKDSIISCEQEILNSYYVYPVMYESSYYTSAKDVKNIQFHPGTGRVSFVYATREK